MESINLFLFLWLTVTVLVLVVYITEMVKVSRKTGLISYLISAVSSTVIVIFVIVLSVVAQFL
ncbi:membrane protein [Candidatus Thiomargarita nelsonii]|uniref:Membrane protein n=1 Tax=Candidatus Thiomargarita nelsonii TaxID=1003181 RepID=A0A176S5Q8_9GAMM|nr:membrane protein [Candidatus Thiomargarita nelsonii]